jgi:RNA polymerase sigma factor (sigma-70 family)
VLLGAGTDAEDIVAESFYQLHLRWGCLRTPEAAGGYLRATVCNLTRMRLRHTKVVRRYLAYRAEHHAHSAEQQAMQRDDERALVAAVQSLPARQRQALVLRYWLDLSEAEIAQTMGISRGAVKSHVARGMVRVSRVMKGLPDDDGGQGRGEAA